MVPAWAFFLPLHPSAAAEEREELKNHHVSNTSHSSTWTENGLSKPFIFVHEQGATCAVWELYHQCFLLLLLGLHPSPFIILHHHCTIPPASPCSQKHPGTKCSEIYVLLHHSYIPDSTLILHAWRLMLNCIVFYSGSTKNEPEFFCFGFANKLKLVRYWCILPKSNGTKNSFIFALLRSRLTEHDIMNPPIQIHIHIQYLYTDIISSSVSSNQNT